MPRGIDFLSATSTNINTQIPAAIYVSLSDVSLLAGDPVSIQTVTLNRETAPSAWTKKSMTESNEEEPEITFAFCLFLAVIRISSNKPLWDFNRRHTKYLEVGIISGSWAQGSKFPRTNW